MGAGINALIAGGVEPVKIDLQDAQVRALQLRNLYAQQQEGQQLAEERRLKNEETRRNTAADAEHGRLIAANTIVDPQTGQASVDNTAVERGLAAAGYGAKAVAAGVQRRADEKAQIETHAAQLKSVADTNKLISNGLQSLTQVPDEQLQDAYDNQRTQWINELGPQIGQHLPPATFVIQKNGVQGLRQFVTQQGAAATDADKQLDNQRADAEYALRLNQFHQQTLKEAPATAEAWLKNAGQIMGSAQTPQQWAAGIHNLQEAGAPQSVIDTFGQAFTPEAQRNAQRLGITAEKRAELASQAITQGQQAQTHAETERHNLETEVLGRDRLRFEQNKAAQEQEVATFTPEAKAKMAEMFATTGTLPPMGYGKAATKQRSDIINQAAANYPNVDFATNKAAFQANSGSLKTLQTTQDRVMSFEATASKNIDVFLKSAGKIIDTGSPLLNAPVRMLSDKAFGSENMAAYRAARETALTEAAKVLESPGGNTALTVTGREAVKTLSDVNATLKQQVAAMKILKQDMANRKQANDDQIQAIKSRIGVNQSASQPAAESSSAGGTIRVKRKSDGKTGTIDSKDFDSAKYDKL